MATITRTVRATCQRCGLEFQFDETYLRRNYDSSKCQSCKAKKTQSISRNGQVCRPWSGEFDWDTMTPIRNGKPYMPGFRKCGAADCVSRNHVLTVESLERERNDLSYRTGIKLTRKEFDRRIKEEKN